MNDQEKRPSRRRNKGSDFFGKEIVQLRSAVFYQCLSTQLWHKVIRRCMATATIFINIHCAVSGWLSCEKSERLEVIT